MRITRTIVNDIRAARKALEALWARLMLVPEYHRIAVRLQSGVYRHTLSHSAPFKPQSIAVSPMQENLVVWATEEDRSLATDTHITVRSNGLGGMVELILIGEVTPNEHE